MNAGSEKQRTAQPPVGIIAASGGMPLDLAHALEASGRGVFIIAIKSMADADFSGFDHAVIAVGSLEKIIAALREKNCTEILLAGKFTRPRMSDAIPDALASKLMVKLLAHGDNAALEMLGDIVGEYGMKLLDKTEILRDHLAGEGLLAGAPASDDAMASILHATAVLEATGDFDIGQAVLVQGMRIIAIEAAEGTDAMMERSRELIDPGLAPPVLVKLLKSGQNPQLDPPVIGADTVEKAARIGVGVIAVEAGGVLIADMQKTFESAEANAITIIGIRR